MFLKIWPWSEIETLQDQVREMKAQRDGSRARVMLLEDEITELKASSSVHRIKILEGHKAQLQRQVDEYRKQANTDVRSGIIHGDRQQATDIKFRSVKTDLQVMKKMNKQASTAIRYVAQHVKSNALQSDLRAIAELIHPDAFNTMGIEHMRSADMVIDTVAHKELVRLSNGKSEE